MDETRVKLLILLLLLEKAGGRETQYAIIRLITRRFGMWDFAHYLNLAKAEGWLITPPRKQGETDHYEITPKGREELNAHLPELRRVIYDHFPGQHEYLDLIFG